ncbi:MAG: aspartyl-phosphate phosphatase Spo0E family protein [Peptostreptococcaceae bacterium]|nr:aspartyl-phosphate phosphatase Spo0E family protein [Peptostreptococcaceae bacterium]
MEMHREKMYTSIGKNGLNHQDTIAASQELDEEIVKEMLKDPAVKCNYLERIIEAREAKIKRLEEKIRNLRRVRRINDLAELAAMLNETGMPAKESVKLSVYIGQVKGI